MIYWECCARSASELNPHGCTYKKFPDDFKDIYVPNLESFISDRQSLQAAESRGSGVSAGPHPKTPANVRRPAAWSEDDDSSRTQAGFRAAFEQLRAGPPEIPTHADESLVGRESASQMWYDIVELYSRRKVTSPTDKLMALKGITDEVARARKLTYMCGLWKEQLLTDLLWFAIEGPDQRLLSRDGGATVAPAWSWASIEGVVALDLLPETSLVGIRNVKKLVTIEDSGPDRSGNAAEITITLRGPLLPVSPPVFDGISMWSIDVGQRGVASARLFPDVKEPDICQMSDLACITFLVLNRTKKSLISSSNEDVQGLVVRLLKAADGEGGVGVYERVGYFTTSYISSSQVATRGRQAPKKAPLTKTKTPRDSIYAVMHLAENAQENASEVCSGGHEGSIGAQQNAPTFDCRFYTVARGFVASGIKTSNSLDAICWPRAPLLHCYSSYVPFRSAIPPSWARSIGDSVS
ncbi:hypothetical protein BGZ57DRAFT_990536 [Hyaloscypha finlandica]|nr:hypothetical protein BGZ57DRAFT_990536 [Hyaloscypha finlandica]